MRPKLLDLFCGAGGAGEGYRRAGFDVTGVDIAPQPHYPHTFIQADALEYVGSHGHEYDAIHASPPCQAHTSLKTMHNAREHADLVPATREALQATGLPYVIENVPGALMPSAIQICGSALGLGVEVHDGWRQLRRHRLFESNVLLLVPPCAHRGATIGIYGDHARDRRRKPGVRDRGVDFSRRGQVELAQKAMGMPWVTSWKGLTQAIPPAYTEYLGRQLLAYVMEQAA